MQIWRLDRKNPNRLRWRKRTLKDSLSVEKPLLLLLIDLTTKEKGAWWLVFNAEEAEKLAEIGKLLFKNHASSVQLVLDAMKMMLGGYWAGPVGATYVQDHPELPFDPKRPFYHCLRMGGD